MADLNSMDAEIKKIKASVSNPIVNMIPEWFQCWSLNKAPINTIDAPHP